LENLERIDAQALIMDIALNARDYSTRYAAIEKLTNQPALEVIAKNSKNITERGEALKKVTNQDFLNKVIIEAAKFPFIRKSCLNNLEDQKLIVQIARTVSHWEVRKTAVVKIHDQVILSVIAQTDADAAVRITAADLIIDSNAAQKLYAQMASTGNNWFYRMNAAKR
jgi:hypothetical protein